MESKEGESSDVGRIKVVVRLRPEIEEDTKVVSGLDITTCAQATRDGRHVKLTRPFYDSKNMVYDHVLDPKCTQEQAYHVVAKDVVDDVIAGFHGTVMCYGQTGAGKTYTVFGGGVDGGAYLEAPKSGDRDSFLGLVPRAVEDIFQHVDAMRKEGHEANVNVSFLEIYMEKVHDLLAPGSSHHLAVREDPKDGVFVDNLSQVPVTSPREVLELIRDGAVKRATGLTAMNKRSSRSHAVIQIALEQCQATESELGAGAIELTVKRSVLTIVDLAGSERVSKSGSHGVRLQEAKKINTSIAALGNCVARLATIADKKAMQHVPFRDSVLTRLLSTSLGGNTKTCLCTNIGPAAAHYEETRNALLFAQRAMRVENHAVINESKDIKALPLVEGADGVLERAVGDPARTDELVGRNKKLEAEVAELRSLLAGMRSPMRPKRPKSDEVEDETEGADDKPNLAPYSLLTSSLARSDSGASKYDIYGNGPRDAREDASKMPPQPVEIEWFEREQELVSRYGRIVKGYQMEIAKQNVIIAKLQRDLRQSNNKLKGAMKAAAATHPEADILSSVASRLGALPGFGSEARSASAAATDLSDRLTSRSALKHSTLSESELSVSKSTTAKEAPVKAVRFLEPPYSSIRESEATPLHVSNAARSTAADPAPVFVPAPVPAPAPAPLPMQAPVPAPDHATPFAPVSAAKPEPVASEPSVRRSFALRERDPNASAASTANGKKKSRAPPPRLPWGKKSSKVVAQPAGATLKAQPARQERKVVLPVRAPPPAPPAVPAVLSSTAPRVVTAKPLPPMSSFSTIMRS